MAISINGNLRGWAAVTHAREIREESLMAELHFRREWDHTLQALEYFMGESDLDKWWESYPEDMPNDKFLPIMKAKLDELDGTLQNVYAQIDQLIGPEPIRQSDYDDLAEVVEPYGYPNIPADKTKRYSCRCRVCKAKFTIDRVSRFAGWALKSGQEYHLPNWVIISPMPACPGCGGYQINSKPIKGVYSEKHKCGPKCTTATGPNCECQCGGENHGIAVRVFIN